ncbi:hypothetical protein WK53_20605 [Burkholderia ubonensis]|uniref:AraC family transcriptional regulator n=1 Tax=Burkholderia ubonensis TaxID=101571 RepID=A0AAW3N5F5_9BURK|nr:hypothetical protein WK53_20605 [Burkholderia ubonensis]
MAERIALVLADRIVNCDLFAYSPRRRHISMHRPAISNHVISRDYFDSPALVLIEKGDTAPFADVFPSHGGLHLRNEEILA